jgi:hypothetical protein
VGSRTLTPASSLGPPASPGKGGRNSPGEGGRDSSGEGGINSQTALCQHINAQGRRCRMPALNAFAEGPCAGDFSLCSYHARRHSQSTPAGEAVAAELLASVNDFTTAASINRFIGNIVTQLARKRIQRRDAIALAYLSQLLLNSLSAMNREESLRDEESRRRPVRVIWDMPCPPYERADPPESTGS